MIKQLSSCGRVGVDQLKDQSGRNFTPGRDLDHLIDSGHRHGKADQAFLPRAGCLRRLFDRKHFQKADAFFTVLHQMNGGRYSHGFCPSGAFDRIPANRFGINIKSHRRPVFVQRNDVAHRHVIRPCGGRNQSLIFVPFGNPESTQRREAAHSGFVRRPLTKENQVVEAERGNVGVVLKRNPRKFSKLKKCEVRCRFDEMTQGGKHFAVRDQAVLNAVGNGETVRLDLTVHGLFFPAGGAVKGQPHQAQNQQHGHNNLAAPFSPEFIRPVEKTKGQRRKNHHAQGIAQVPVPPGEERFGGFNNAQGAQTAHADRGRNQAGRQSPQQKKTK